MVIPYFTLLPPLDPEEAPGDLVALDPELPPDVLAPEDDEPPVDPEDDPVLAPEEDEPPVDPEEDPVLAPEDDEPPEVAVDPVVAAPVATPDAAAPVPVSFAPGLTTLPKPIVLAVGRATTWEYLRVVFPSPKSISTSIFTARGGPWGVELS